MTSEAVALLREIEQGVLFVPTSPFMDETLLMRLDRNSKPRQSKSDELNHCLRAARELLQEEIIVRSRMVYRLKGQLEMLG